MPKKLAALLRTLAERGQYGHARTPASYYMTPSYCSFYHNNYGFVVPDHETWIRVCALSARYHRFVGYVREVLPAWREIERINFMDNSIEAVQESRTGERRRVMVKAPSGDVCY
jgi:hypothetical protein